ncbi:MAG: Fur family transcriptional regulator [Bacillota bacterium]
MNKLSILNTDLKSLGLKATPQRLAILEFLDGNTGHPTAEAIYQALKPRYPSLSLATVYNTLDALRKAGKVVELTINPLRRHFDPDTAFHHHFLCRSCQGIADLEGDFAGLPHPKMPEGFKLEEVIIYYYGLCPGCQKNSK